MQHILDARFDTPLAEGQRAGRNSSFRRGAGQQRLRIIRAPSRIHRPHDLFVARKLDIAAEHAEGDPHERVEPVQRKHCESQRLPPVVAAGEVRALMRDDVRRRSLVHVHGEIDLRPDHAENKGRGNRFALVDILPQPYGSRQLPAQPPRARKRVNKQRRHADKPHPRHDEGKRVQRVDAHHRLCGKALADDGVDRLVDNGYAARDGRARIVVYDLGRDRLGAGYERERALDGKRADEPQRGHAPQQRKYPARHPFQQQPRRQHCQHQPARADAEVHDLQKNVSHGASPPGIARSCAAPRQTLGRSCGGTWQTLQQTPAVNRRISCPPVHRSRPSAPRCGKQAR